MAVFKIAIDPGGSLTKVILEVNKVRHYLVMKPQIIKLPRASIEVHKNFGVGMDVHPEDTAWVQTPDDGDECYVIGDLAEQFLGTSRLQKLKYESAAYKGLAALGSIAQLYGIPNRSKIDTIITLPYGEFQNSSQLIEQLQKNSKSFTFRGKKHRFQLNLQCCPEGTGLFFWQVAEKGMEWVRESRFDVLMIGHRNISYLHFVRGQLCQGVSSNLGIHQLVRMILNKTSGQSEAAILPILCSERALCPQLPAVQNALRSDAPGNRAKEAELLVEAIQLSKIDYWRSLNEWMGSVEGQQKPGILIISGGGAYLPFLQTELCERFRASSINWCQDLHEEITQVLRLQPEFKTTTHPLAIRLADPYALLETIAENENEVA